MTHVPGSSRSTAGALALVLLSAGACTPSATPTEPIALSLGLRPKPSCDLTPVQYTTECLAAVEVLLVPESGAPAQRTCVPLEGDKRFANLADLLTADDPVIRFATLTGRGAVVFKVRGIHDKALLGADPCDPNTSSQHWLFWGESPPIVIEDAAEDGGVVDITLSVDCRDCQGGCQRVGSPQCPARLPPSYCVPFSPGFSCARRCDDDQECFEGAIACGDDDGRCHPSGGAPGSGDTGGFCFPCQDSGDCDVGYSCVGAPNASQGLCARDCPLNRCLSGASCRRLGPDLVVFSGADDITLADAGPDDGG